jgi:hypothetical protein
LTGSDLALCSGDARPPSSRARRVGALRLTGFASRAATAEGGEKSWRLSRRRFSHRVIQARDETGAAVGEFEPRALCRGGVLRWADREFALRPASHWRERSALAEGDRELAILDGKGWGRRPVEVIIETPDAVELGLLLFPAFVVRGLAEDAGGGERDSGSSHPGS